MAAISEARVSLRASKTMWFEAKPQEVRRARRFTRAQLIEWRLVDELVERAESIVSELATNAVTAIHKAYGEESELRFKVQLNLRDAQLHIDVLDTAPGDPETWHALAIDDDAGKILESGRGLALVRSWADKVEIIHTPHNTAKSVIAILEIP